MKVSEKNIGGRIVRAISEIVNVPSQDNDPVEPDEEICDQATEDCLHYFLLSTLDVISISDTWS